jgi:hypothetical protein
MKTSRFRRFAIRDRRLLALLLALLAVPGAAEAQSFAQRGFVDGTAFMFPQTGANDPTRVVADLTIRDEVFAQPAGWVRFAAGLDVRASSHHHVDDRWQLDLSDRGVRRPRLALRRLTATVAGRGVTVDAGKQFIRWGKTDIVTPTDRFAPRDFLNVVDTEFLPVFGVRTIAELGKETFDVVWVPRFTPSRVPLLDDRWSAVPDAGVAGPLVDRGAVLPKGSEFGIRWGHAGAGVEYSLSLFDGFNHLPNIGVQPRLVQNEVPARIEIDVTRSYPSIRTYGGDLAIPTRWFTVKAETAYFTSSSVETDEYVLYVIQLERQAGEWVFIGGYAGETVTSARAPLTFSPDRGMARAVVARAAYTIGPTSSIGVEGAVRRTGAYVKGEYSHAYGQHWRATVAVVGIGGRRDDFLGQYRRNSHGTLNLRYSF